MKRLTMPVVLLAAIPLSSTSLSNVVVAEGLTTESTASKPKRIKRLEVEVESLKAEVDDLRRQLSDLVSRNTVHTVQGSTILEYGFVVFEKGRKEHWKNIVFRNEYVSPPLVLVCESGTVGKWVVVKSEGISTQGAQIAVKDAKGYRCRIGYIVIGEGRFNDQKTIKKTSRRKNKSRPRDSRTSKNTKTDESTNTLLEYTILDEEIIDTPGKASADIDILVSGKLSEAELRDLLHRLFTINKARVFVHRSDPTAIWIQAYTSRERFASGVGLWVAQLTWYNDQEQPSIAIKQIQIREDRDKPKRKLGLSEALRKQIYWELMEADYKGVYEADQKFPAPNPKKPGVSIDRVRKQDMKRRRFEEKLKRKYKAIVARKHKISSKRLEEIELEGFTYDWPVPPWKYGPPSVEE